MTNRYEIIIFWSDEDQAFIADVPELPGCMAHVPVNTVTRFQNQKVGVSFTRRRQVRASPSKFGANIGVASARNSLVHKALQW
jgi:hypothetical protein